MAHIYSNKCPLSNKHLLNFFWWKRWQNPPRISLGQENIISYFLLECHFRTFELQPPGTFIRINMVGKQGLLLFGFNAAFSNFSVISRLCLIATGSSVLTFIVLPRHWRIMPYPCSFPRASMAVHFCSGSSRHLLHMQVWRITAYKRPIFLKWLILFVFGCL